MLNTKTEISNSTNTRENHDKYKEELKNLIEQFPPSLQEPLLKMFKDTQVGYSKLLIAMLRLRIHFTKNNDTENARLTSTLKEIMKAEFKKLSPGEFRNYDFFRFALLSTIIANINVLTSGDIVAPDVYITVIADLLYIASAVNIIINKPAEVDSIALLSNCLKEFQKK